MIRKLSDFIVNKRIAILVVMLILAAVCIVSSRFVVINEDMTKYLPDDSNMKAGLDIMDEAFPETETSNTIRVMFDGLTAVQKSQIPDELGSIPYVDSVDYAAGYHSDLRRPDTENSKEVPAYTDSMGG